MQFTVASAGLPQAHPSEIDLLRGPHQSVHVAAPAFYFSFLGLLLGAPNKEVFKFRKRINTIRDMFNFLWGCQHPVVDFPPHFATLNTPFNEMALLFQHPNAFGNFLVCIHLSFPYSESAASAPAEG